MQTNGECKQNYRSIHLFVNQILLYVKLGLRVCVLYYTIIDFHGGEYRIILKP